MSDVAERTILSVTQGRPAETERRRPGRVNDLSPALIALMRQPTPEARRAVALYDAPNFVLPDAPAGHATITSRQVFRLLAATGACAVVWAAAFRGMMMLWG